MKMSNIHLMKFLTRKWTAIQHIPFKSQVTQKAHRAITREYRDIHPDYSRTLYFLSIYSKQCVIIFLNISVQINFVYFNAWEVISVGDSSKHKVLHLLAVEEKADHAPIHSHLTCPHFLSWNESYEKFWSYGFFFVLFISVAVRLFRGCKDVKRPCAYWIWPYRAILQIRIRDNCEARLFAGFVLKNPNPFLLGRSVLISGSTKKNCKFLKFYSLGNSPVHSLSSWVN